MRMGMNELEKKLYLSIVIVCLLLLLSSLTMFWAVKNSPKEKIPEKHRYYWEY